MADSTTIIIILVAALGFSSIAAVAGILIFKPEWFGLGKKRKDADKDATDPPVDGSKDKGGGKEPPKDAGGGGDPIKDTSTGYKRASATWYMSYPDCCHDPKADQTECKSNSGCKWAGLFAGLDGKQNPEWVKKTNIVAFYEAPEGTNKKVWDSKYKGKKIRVRNPKTGKALDATIYDTCSDSDCGGCCSANAKRSGGNFLVDLEINTAKRFWGTQNPPGLETVEWKLI